MDKKQKRAAALKRQQELVNAAKAASREMTAEETAEFNTLQGQIDQLNRESSRTSGPFGRCAHHAPGSAAGNRGTRPDSRTQPGEGNLCHLPGFRVRPR